MIDPREVVMAFNTRRRNKGASIARMVEVQRMYDGDIWIPLPELDETERPSVANLLLQGVDQLGMRLSSVLPDLNFPVERPGVDKYEVRSARQRKAFQGWENMNNLSTKEARRSRFLVAYGCGPMMVKPVGNGAYQKRDMPYWHVLNPLAAFPAESSDPDDIEPSDIILHRHITLGWLTARYPVAASRLYKGPSDRDGNHPPDIKFDLLEYNDAEETVLVVVGAKGKRFSYVDINDGSTPYELLERTPNRAEMCLAVVPGRITLSRMQGCFDQIIGMFMAQAKMTAYEAIAVERGIFPQLWAVSHPNSPTGAARIVVVADGKQGVIGEIEGGTIIPINPQSGPAASQAVDRLERGQRVQASIPADWGGESANNIRTAKRGDQISTAATEPTLGELQNIVAASKEAEATRAIAVEKGWFGGKTVSFYMPRSGKLWGETFIPNELFTTDYVTYKFSMPGVDAAGIPIELGQRTQTGAMSQDTARRMDPMIEDPDHERDMVELEGLRLAALKGLEQLASTGQLDPHEIALIAQLKRSGQGLELEECIIQAHDIMQRQQAAQAQQTQQAPPGAPPTPGQMPGIGATPPPAAAQQGPPPLAQVMGMLRQPAQQIPAEAPAAAAGG